MQYGVMPIVGLSWAGGLIRLQGQSEEESYLRGSSMQKRQEGVGEKSASLEHLRANNTW